MKKQKNKKLDPYKYDKLLKNSIRLLEDDPQVSDANKKLVLDFDNHNKLKQTSIPYRIKCIYVLRYFGQLAHKKLDTCGKKDMKEIVGRLIDSDRWGDEWKAHMLKTLKTAFKYFKDSKEFPEEVDWIQVKRPPLKTIKHQECISIEEAKELGDTTQNDRDRAFIKALMWEAGLRIKEALTLQIKDVEHMDDCCFLNLDDTKTKVPRKVLVYIFYGDLLDWLNHHPKKNNEYAPVVCNLLNGRQGGTIRPEAASKILRVAHKRMGLEKRSNPHWYRHSSISYFCQCPEFTQNEISMKYWGVPNSSMLRRYAHLNLYKTAERVTGNADGKVETPKPWRCPYCGHMNDGLDEKCRCGKYPNYQRVLDSKRAELALFEWMKQTMYENPEQLADLTGRMKEKKPVETTG